MNDLTIFQQGSRTYSTASMFFPRQIKENVTKLYAFVRLADNFVDQQPANAAGFEKFYSTYRDALAGKKVKNAVISNFVKLANQKNFDPSWTEAFFAAMRQDLTVTSYATIQELEKYMYGSAEVIGLMMARLLDLPTEAERTARLLGKTMQYCNFLRDVDEDLQLGRVYIPQSVLHRHGFSTFSKSDAVNKKKQFRKLMTSEVARYHKWLAEAEMGFRFLPKRARVAIKTATDMYSWTANQIAKRPQLVFEKKLKPAKFQIILMGVKNFILG